MSAKGSKKPIVYTVSDRGGYWVILCGGRVPLIASGEPMRWNSLQEAEADAKLLNEASVRDANKS